ncbi:MAG: helix-turn-helix transcriptional regulator [Gemmatimonadaceae bacterium]
MSTAPEQLKRLLALLPEISAGAEHRIEDVARRINADPDALLRDLRDVSQRLDDPPGWVESVQIFIEAEKVSMGPSPHFRRPMRLTVDEWRALELGLAIIRAERAPDERAILDTALEKVRLLVSQEPKGESTRSAILGGEKHTNAVSALRGAIRDHRRVEITYQKGSGDAPSTRTICPYSFVVEQGVWYLVALCSRSEAIRIFRLDRVLELKVLIETFEPADIDVDKLLSDGRAFAGSPPETLRVRYSPKVARWIAEREQGTALPDGSIEVEYPLGDESWAVRHVLQYGPEAVVVAPEAVRQEIRKRLEALVS